MKPAIFAKLRVATVSLLIAGALASCNKEKPRRSHSRDESDDDGPSSESGSFTGVRRSADAERVCKQLLSLHKADQEKKKEKEKDRPGRDPDKQLDECTMELSEVQEVSPDAFDCIEGCAAKSDFEAAIGCYMKCNESDEKLKAYQKKKREEKESQRARKMVQWTKHADKTFDGVLKHYDGKEVKYSLTLVDGFTEDTDMKSDTLKYYRLEDKKDDYIIGPSVNVSFAYNDDLDKAVSSVETMKEKVVKKEKTSNGFSIQSEGDGSISVEVMMKEGDLMLECKARIYNSKASDFKADLLPWMDKMCRSLKIK